MESELSLREKALATKSDLHVLELKVEALRGEVRTDLQSLRAELIGEIRGTIRWNFAFWIAQLAAIAGILKLLK